MNFLRKFPWSLLLAVALCVIAWSVKSALEEQIGELTPFLLFFGAIMIATWNGGLGIGVFAALLSACLAEYFFLAPTRSFQITSAGLVQLGVFLLEGFFISLLTARARLAHDSFRAQVQRQSALAELSQLALARIDNLDSIFERAVELCAQTLVTSSVAIIELDRREIAESGDHFVVRATIAKATTVTIDGAKASVVETNGATTDGTTTDGATTDGANASGTNVSQVPGAMRWVARPASPESRAIREGFDAGNIAGDLNVPIGPVEKYWGILQIGAPRSGHQWSSEQIEWVRALVGVLGVAIAGHGARAQAAQGELRYRSFVRQSSEAIWRFEMDEPVDMSLNRAEILELAWQNGFMAECNDALAKMYGFERAEQMIGMRLWQLMNRDDERVREFLMGLITDDFRVSEAESVETDRDGVSHILLSSLTGIVEDGRLLRVWGRQRDVTAEREVTRELAASELRFRSLFDVSPVPLGIGRGQNVLYVNRALSDLLGYPNPEALIGKPITDFVAPEEREQIGRRALNRAQGGDEPLIYESSVQKYDGAVFPARVEMAQIALPEGAATLMFLFDLTDQKSADAAIAQLLDGSRDATLRAQNLQEISFDLLRQRAPEAVARVAIERVMRAVGARGGVLLAPDQAENAATLINISALGYPEGTVDQYPSIDAGGMHPMAHVFRTREPLWMDKAADWSERFPVLDETLPRTGTQSIAMLPLEVEGRVVSVMALSWSEPRAFDDESRLFLQTLANSCAQSLERARLDIQARDLARRQQESLALLNTLLESAPVGFALFDQDQRYVLINGALAQMNGKPVEAHLGKTMRELVPEPEPEFEKRLSRVWKSGRASGEFVLMDEYSGERRFCLVSLYPVRIENSAELLGVGSIVIEISERVRDEEEKTRLVAELETERARLEAILQQMPSAVVIGEAPSGRLLLGNHQVERVLGMPFVSSDSIEEYNYPGLWPDGRKIQPQEWPLARAITNGETVRNEEFIVPNEQGARVVRITASPIRDRNGKITAGIAIFDDVTERARAEAAQRFLADAGSALIATLDASSGHDRLARLCVPEVADWCILAIPSEDGLLRGASIAHADAADSEAAKQFQRQLARDAAPPWDIAGALSSGRAQLYHSQDLEYLQSISASPEYVELIGRIDARSAIVAPLAARGRTLGLMIWITTGSRRTYDERDLELAQELARRAALTTDNTRLFSESQQARDQAQAANLAKDEFLAVVSHELRTPLTPILGWLDLLRSPNMSDELRAQAYDVIERNARAQAQLVNDILDVSRITSGKLRLQLEALDLTQLVRDAIESLRLTADAKGVELRLDLAEVGAASMDASRFQQVVWNLMSNAVKFTPAQGQVSISLSQKDEQTAILEIADSGQGIAPQFVPNVFEAFRQADSSATRKAGGLGLGLAIVRHIVELHGGRVSAASEGEGKGATFRVEVPLLGATDAENLGNASEVAPLLGPVGQLDEGKQIMRGARILLVDDDPDTRETLARLLEGQGARVRVASSATEALQALEKFAPQLAISDIGMPDMDGYSLLPKMRAIVPDLPAIALTAYAAPSDVERAKQAGFQRHLAKPVEAGALITASEELLTA